MDTQTISNTIYIVDLEPVETRYTGEWKTHIPKLLQESLDIGEVVVIEGPDDIPEATTPGAFLNFGGTNIYKSSQMMQISRLFCEGKIKNGDQFLYTDAWNPTILQLKYMSQLLGIPVKIHALWHAGNYDENDFLGRLIKDEWVRDCEMAMAKAIDYNWFASEYHIELFRDKFGLEGNLFRTGWPMEYLKDKISLGTYKEDIILFPHRIAPEKQVEIFKDLAKYMPEYQFIVCQEEHLTKPEYHQLLKRSRMVFSANLQETLGISCYEGVLAGAIPAVPNRLSYDEMYDGTFKYPSEWTESFESYEKNRAKLVTWLRVILSAPVDVTNAMLKKQAEYLHDHYFSCDGLIKEMNALT